MAIARQDLIAPDGCGCYHITSRCVRRAFLCADRHRHRRDWLAQAVERCALACGGAIEVFAFSIMANHLHLVVKLYPLAAQAWNAREVAERWAGLWPARDRLGEPLPADESLIAAHAADSVWVEKHRKRLASVSWFMKAIKEPIAKRANKEDQVTGHFWEGRFHSQHLLTQGAVIAAMAYVDLNPTSAKMAATPEGSDYTSIRERIRTRQAWRRQEGLRNERLAPALATTLGKANGECPPPLSGPEDRLWCAPIHRCLIDQGPDGGCHDPLTVDEYSPLIDETGRIIKSGKRGAIPAHLAPILERLELNIDRWLDAMRSAGSLAGRAIGTARSCAAAAARAGKRRFCDKARIFKPPVQAPSG